MTASPIHAAPLWSTGRDHQASIHCWCGPILAGRDLATMADVYRHRTPPSSSTLRGDALATAMDRHEGAGDARERRALPRPAGHRLPGAFDPRRER